MKKHLKDWNFKKHFMVVTAIYAVLYTIDLTLGYLVAKKVLPKSECACKKKVC